MRQMTVRLKDGTTVIGDDFDMQDYEKLKSIMHKVFNQSRRLI